MWRVCGRFCRVLAVAASLAGATLAGGAERTDRWRAHVVVAPSGQRINTAVGGDFTGDGRADVICSAGGKTLLLVAPQWKPVVLEDARRNLIHSEAFDVDGDGDLDFVGAQYSPGLVYWLEQPDSPAAAAAGAWKSRTIDDQLNGIHGLLQADVDGDGRVDLLANSGQPKGRFPNSAAWLKAPRDARAEGAVWQRTVFAAGDAPGLSHYLGFGDLNGDGRPDIALAAKGGPQAEPGEGEWFAWWEAPSDPLRPGWKRHLVSDKQPGATNIHVADLNGDGRADLLATRGHGRGVVWFEAPKWHEHVIHPTLQEPHSLVVADLDNDGDIDAATCAYGDQQAVWFENDGRGGFQSHVLAERQAAYDLRAIDMDGDGDLDLLIAGQQTENVVYLENPAR